MIDALNTGSTALGRAQLAPPSPLPALYYAIYLDKYIVLPMIGNRQLMDV